METSPVVKLGGGAVVVSSRASVPLVGGNATVCSWELRAGTSEAPTTLKE